ncbi:MAG TPA: putative glycoside hydrolase [Spirochaetales bacterium]|nr:putative glycoside hydrolase [Spirochaetales bacterium]
MTIMTTSNRRHIRPLVLWVLLAYVSLAGLVPGYVEAQGFSAGGLQSGDFLLGTEQGLFKVVLHKNLGTGGASDFEFELLMGGSEVGAIVPAPYGWFFLTSNGIVFSADLKKFENRSLGLPTRTFIAVSDDGIVPRREPVEIKALAVDATKQGRIAACTASEVFLSENRGVTWTSLGSPSTSPGLKALIFAPKDTSGGMALWVSHTIRGVFSLSIGLQSAAGGGGGSGVALKQIIEEKSKWVAQSAGLPRVFGSNVEEVSSFALFANFSGQDAGEGELPALVAGLTFLGRYYRFDIASMRFVEVYAPDGNSDFDIAESLSFAGTDFGYSLGEGTVQALHMNSKTGKLRVTVENELASTLRGALQAIGAASPGAKPCAAFPRNFVQKGSQPFALNELWLLRKGKKVTQDLTQPEQSEKPEQFEMPAALRQERLAKADGKTCIYLQTGFVINAESRAHYFELMANLGINGLVVDMKDDEGNLRFAPQSELLKEFASGTARDTISGTNTISGTGTLDLETFVQEAKARGIYLIARVVVFKDSNLYKWNGGLYAVRNKTTGALWQGTRPDGSLIAEKWVGPYSSDVWAYNVEIAKEVIVRGFDEVQFDYIRFPTDGENLAVIDYPHKLPGMTPETALESFLQYARQEISAPISVDIYGSNGWYRSGSRTGQDVEMFSDYVDVICPMLYPSHFEQDFLAFEPAQERPYRIYRLGTLRNATIARDAALIRPYVQAFYLNVSYDKLYYDKAYVQREIQGVKDGANHGMIFWNNSGRYTDLEP